MWTGEFDLNTLRVDGEVYESEKKKLRIQKYPDTCGRGLLSGVLVTVVVVFPCFSLHTSTVHNIVISKTVADFIAGSRTKDKG